MVGKFLFVDLFLFHLPLILLLIFYTLSLHLIYFSKAILIYLIFNHVHMCVSLCENVHVWVCRCPCSQISWTWNSRQFKAIQCRFLELFLGPLQEPNLFPALKAISFTHFRYFLTLHIVPFIAIFVCFTLQYIYI